MKRLCSIILSIVLLFISTPFVSANYATSNSDFIQQDQKYITREEAIAIFVRAIKGDVSHADTAVLRQFTDYSKVSSTYTRELATAVSSGMISGYDDRTLRPQEKINRVEALVILNRILGNRSLPSDVELSFFDTPLWAEKDILRLTRAGIVQGYGDGYMGAKDFLSREQTTLLAQRAARLTGPTGDFYEYANENWLSETDVPDGYAAWSDFYAINQQIKKENGDIIYSINRRRNKEGEDFPKGSSEQKIADMFAAAGNTVYRNSLGLGPAKPYLSSIDEITDIKSLLTVMASLEKSGFSCLLPFSVEINAFDSSKYVLSFSESYTGIPASSLDTEDAAASSYQAYLTKLFTLFDYKDPETRAKNVTDLCVNIKQSSTPLEERLDIEKNYHILQGDSLTKLFGNFNFPHYLAELGFDNDVSVACYDISLAQTINTLICEDNLSLIKDYLRASVMDSSSLYLDTTAYEIWQDYQNSLYGTQLQAVPSDYAIQFIEELLPWDLANLYVEKYASPSAKEAVESMTGEILRAYRNRVRVCTWMSDATKEVALKKLNSLQVRVGYPDDIQSYLDEGYEVPSIKDGGNILLHRANRRQRYYQLAASVMGKEAPKKNIWSLVPQTVNAMYEPSTNSITIPAGILREPFYDPNASRERNLGGIGFVIAHEISHSLDDVGSRFDENGNLKSWWTPEDTAAFSSICRDVESAYSSIELFPGQTVDGKLTLNENISDLAGMSCLLDVVGAGNPRLDDLFIGYATIWRNKTTETYATKLLSSDNHSPDKIRVNRVLSNFNIFINYYDVQPGDGMYLPKEKQIQIWNR